MSNALDVLSETKRRDYEQTLQREVDEKRRIAELRRKDNQREDRRREENLQIYREENARKRETDHQTKKGREEEKTTVNNETPSRKYLDTSDWQEMIERQGNHRQIIHDKYEELYRRADGDSNEYGRLQKCYHEEISALNKRNSIEAQYLNEQIPLNVAARIKEEKNAKQEQER